MQKVPVPNEKVQKISPFGMSLEFRIELGSFDALVLFCAHDDLKLLSMGDLVVL